MRGLFLITLIAAGLTGCNMFLDPYELGPDGQQTPDTGTTDMGTADAGPTDMGSATDSGMPTDMDSMPDMGMDGGEEEDMAMPDNRLVVFDDDYAAGLAFVPFGGSDNNVSVVADEGVDGSAAILVQVPATGYTGGTFVPSQVTDVSGFNALHFSVRASKEAELNVSGLGITGTNVSLLTERNVLPVTTEWTTYTIPLPAPSKLDNIPGVFHFAEGSEEGSYDIFFDDIEYVDLPANSFVGGSATMGSGATLMIVGETQQAPDTTYTTQYSGNNISLRLAGGHLDWNSSDRQVATVDGQGAVTSLAEGTTSISGAVAGLQAGSYDVDVVTGPASAAPGLSVNSVAAALFSDQFSTVPVDTFNRPLGGAELSVIDIQGDQTLVYSALDFAVMEMVGANSLDVSNASALSLDLWTADGVEFRVKLVDFGADNAFDGGDDTEQELAFTLSALPGYVSQDWYTLEIPLTDFTDLNLGSLTNISQIIIVGRSLDVNGSPVPGQSTFFIDNIVFRR